MLAKAWNLTTSVLGEHDQKKRNEHLAKLEFPCIAVRGTVLDVTGQFVAVQDVDNPCSISLVYVKGKLPTGLTPGKTVMMHGKFKKGIFNTENITITEKTPWVALETPPQPVGMIDRIIFFIAYCLFIMVL
jgi:cytochrome c-type biogenesis protein CcmE